MAQAQGQRVPQEQSQAQRESILERIAGELPGLKENIGNPPQEWTDKGFQGYSVDSMALMVIHYYDEKSGKVKAIPIAVMKGKDKKGKNKTTYWVVGRSEKEEGDLPTFALTPEGEVEKLKEKAFLITAYKVSGGGEIGGMGWELHPPDTAERKKGYKALLNSAEAPVVKDLGLKGLPEGWEEALCCKGRGFLLSPEGTLQSLSPKAVVRSGGVPIVGLKSGEGITYYYYDEKEKTWKPTPSIIAAKMLYKTDTGFVPKWIFNSKKNAEEAGKAVLGDISAKLKDILFKPFGNYEEELTAWEKLLEVNVKEAKEFGYHDLAKALSAELEMVRDMKKRLSRVAEEWKKKGYEVYAFKLPVVLSLPPSEGDHQWHSRTLLLPSIVAVKNGKVEEVAVYLGGELWKGRDGKALASYISTIVNGEGGDYTSVILPTAKTGEGEGGWQGRAYVHYKQPRWVAADFIWEFFGLPLIERAMKNPTPRNLFWAGMALAGDLSVFLPGSAVGKGLKVLNRGPGKLAYLIARNALESRLSRFFTVGFVYHPMLEDMRNARGPKDYLKALGKAALLMVAFSASETAGGLWRAVRGTTAKAGEGVVKKILKIVGSTALDLGALVASEEMLKKLGWDSREKALEDLRALYTTYREFVSLAKGTAEGINRLEMLGLATEAAVLYTYLFSLYSTTFGYPSLEVEEETLSDPLDVLKELRATADTLGATLTEGMGKAYEAYEADSPSDSSSLTFKDYSTVLNPEEYLSFIKLVEEAYENLRKHIGGGNPQEEGREESSTTP